MKKIVILLESHIDYPSSNAQLDLVAHLKNHGFNALGLEYPVSGTELREALESTIQVSTQNCLYPALSSLLLRHKLTKINNKPINANTLFNIQYFELCNLLERYVTSQNYENFARVILGIRPTQNKLEMIRRHSDIMEIVGIDTELTFAESARPLVENFERREIKMVDNIEALFKQGKNAVHIVGKNHAPGLVKLLAAKQILEHTLFLDLSSPETIAVDPDYLKFAQHYRDIINPIMINPETGITPHLTKINTLLGIDSQVKLAFGIAPQVIKLTVYKATNKTG